MEEENMLVNEKEELLTTYDSRNKGEKQEKSHLWYKVSQEINVSLAKKQSTNDKILKDVLSQLVVTKHDKNVETSSFQNSQIVRKSVTFEVPLTNQRNSKEEFSDVVRFFIDDEVFASKFKSSSTTKKIVDKLNDVLELENDSITLHIDGIEVEPYLSLTELKAKINGKIEFEIWPLCEKALVLQKVKENIPTLDVITVHTIDKSGGVEDVVVEIENRCSQKEWLGGFQSKKTNVVYHNATTQTAPKHKPAFDHSNLKEPIPLLYHRDTQTPFKPKETVISTSSCKATQMWRRDLFIHSKTDKIMTAKPYIDYDSWCRKSDVEEKVIRLQRAVRKWINRKKIRELINHQKIIVQDIKRLNQQLLKEQADKEREIITSTDYPVKRDDFYMLYLVIGKWWAKEWKRICRLRSEESKKAESVLLLRKEVELLETIEKHRIVVKGEALKKERMRFLELSARPIVFKNEKGHMVSIDDLESQRAREFKEIYSALVNKNIVPKDRIDLLLTLKQLFVSNYMDYEYAYDLVSLIEREVDLLSMGIKPKKLAGLHKRIKQLYMNFLEQKEFNPKAEKYKKPNYPKTLDALFLCTRCLKLLPASKFPVHVRMTNYSECTSCTWLKNIGHQRVDMSPYLKLLKYIQNLEMEKCCHSAVCFILQPLGMSFLTNVIWHGHSAISECSDMSKLQHVRWLSDVEWSPWNTILLTDQEAKCHSSIPDVFQFYDKTFIESVRQKHIIARIQLLPLLKMDHEIRSSGAWSTIKDSGVFLHPSHVEELAVGKDYDKI